MVSMIEKKLSIDSDKTTKISWQFSISIVSDRKSIVNCQLVVYIEVSLAEVPIVARGILKK